MASASLGDRRPQRPGDVQSCPLGRRCRPPLPTAQAECPGELGDERVELGLLGLGRIEPAGSQGLVGLRPQLLDAVPVGGPGTSV